MQSNVQTLIHWITNFNKDNSVNAFVISGQHGCGKSYMINEVLSNIDNIPQIIDKICLFSTDQINILREKYPNKKQLNDRLNAIEKYNNMIDEDYIQDLRDEDDDYNNKSLIKRAKDFKKLTYETIKNTLYNEGKKIKKQIKKD